MNETKIENENETATASPTLADRLARRLAIANAGLEAARRTLATSVTDGDRADRIADLLANLADYEGAARALSYAARIAENAPNEEAARSIAREVVTDALLDGADDRWSGRGNDAKRAEFDGYRRGARIVLRELDR